MGKSFLFAMTKINRLPDKQKTGAATTPKDSHRCKDRKNLNILQIKLKKNAKK